MKFACKAILFSFVIGFSACSSSGGGGGSFTIGGTVTGLIGTLVLQNNGGDDLTLSADGPFTFDTEVDNEEAYDVTVELPPVGFNCQITGGAGTVSGANVSDVSITCEARTWTIPIGLTDNISDDAGFVIGSAPGVALNASGETLLAWAQSGTGTDQIYRAEYVGGEWTYPANVYDTVSPKGEDASNPQVAINKDGDAIIVWQQSDGTNEQIFLAERRGGEWTPPASVTDNISPDGTDAINPKVVIADNGEAVIVWIQDIGGGDTRLFMSEYRAGEWTHPADIDDFIGPTAAATTASNQLLTDLAMNASGCTILTWTQSDGTGIRGYSAEYLADATWNFPTSFAEHFALGGFSIGAVSAGIDEECDGIIAWRQQDGSNQHIFKRQLSNGTWSVPPNLADSLSPDGTDAASPDVAMNELGDAVIAWRQTDGDAEEAMFRSILSGGSFSNPATTANEFSPDGQGVTSNGSAAIDVNGEAVIAWIQSDATNAQVFLSEFRDGSWLAPTDTDDNISPDTTDVNLVVTAASRNGDMVVLWRQDDGTGNQQLFIAEYR